MEKKIKRCIVSFADGIHLVAQQRLVRSITSHGFDGDILIYTPQNIPDGFPTFDASPWGFKPFLCNVAKNLGYQHIMWVDASVICIRNPKPIFQQIQKNGYFLFGNNVSNVREWSSDYTLKQMGISDTVALKIPELRAHIIGLDTYSPQGSAFLQAWLDCASDGISFRGLPPQHPLAETFHNNQGQISSRSNVHGHRHDQTVASIIAHSLHMKITSKYSIDYVGEIESTHKPIEYDCVFLQDRAYKHSPLRDIDWSDNQNTCIGKCAYFIYAFIYTWTKRCYKYTLWILN